MPSLPVSFRLQARQLFSELSIDTKMKCLSRFSAQDLHQLYSISAYLVNSIIKIEFNLPPNKHDRLVKRFFDTYRRDTPGATTEDTFLRALFCELVPILYYYEHEKKLVTTTPVDLDTFYIFLVDFFMLSFKPLPVTREVELKTYELKRYPKTRVDLKPEDQFYVSFDDDRFVILQACVFQVNRLRVLCGFFAKNCHENSQDVDESSKLKWRSEKYVSADQLSHIVESYDLVRRKLD